MAFVEGNLRQSIQEWNKYILWETGCFPQNLLSPLLNAFSHLVYALKDVLLEYIKLSLKSKIKSLIYKTFLMHLPITVANMQSA